MKIRKNLIVLTILTVFFLYLPFQAGAVVQWTKSGSNPVLSPASSGSWDDYSVCMPAVIKDGSTYKMWYTGTDDIYSNEIPQTGYATSSDGIAWTRGNGGNPVLPPGSSGEWDDRCAAAVGVIKEGSTYKMWYSGSDDSSGEIDTLQIGYATSTDAINWTKYDDPSTPNAPYADSDPVLTKGTAGTDWDGDVVYGPTVIIDNDAPAPEKYKVWYVGEDNTLGTIGIGYAYSSDGINWTKYNNPGTGAPYANSDPVIWPGPIGAWNEDGVYPPTVIKEDSVYRMWLNGDNANDKDTIGYYSSVDGINWTQYKGNPVVMEGDIASDDFDEYGASTPTVLKDGATYKMWYSGDKDCDPCLNQIGYATAPAYSGTDLKINDIQARINNASYGIRTAVCFITEGPGFLDFNELKVDGPSGFSHTFTDSDIWNDPGGIIHFFSTTQIPGAGTYTFTAKSNNGLIATESLIFSSPTILPVPGTGSGAGELDMQIQVGTTTHHNEAYIGTTTPTFRFKPAGGTDKHYRVKVYNFRSLWTVWWSDLIPGTATDVNGYIEVSAPANVLVADTPYTWRIDIYDTDDPWTGHNRASCDKWVFYTGTKDTSATPDFIDYTAFRSQRDFLYGDSTNFGFEVNNLAPWDIHVSDGTFSVLNEGGAGTFYNFNIIDSARTEPTNFYYFGSISGFPADAISTGYEFVVAENTNFYFENVKRLYQDVSTLPMVTRKDMLLNDNAYLTKTTPTLSWVSKGAGYKYRILVISWSGRLTYLSSFQNGLPAGQIMSETIPYGTLEGYDPYYWYVEIFDTNEYSRTRSNRLTFMTGGEENILNDELAVDFGVNGLWHYDGAAWSKKTSWNPDDDLTGWIGWTYGLAVDFGSNGLWNYDGMAWKKKTSWDAGSGGMAGWSGGLAVDFDGSGLWNYDGTTWSKKTNWDPDDDLAGWSGGLAVDFGTNGLWNYDGSTWSKKTGLNAGYGGMAGWSGGLAVDFDSNGLWNYDGSTWSKKTSWDAGSGGLCGWSGGLAVDFDGNGLWNYDGTTWSKKTSLDPEGISALGSGFAADFGASGLWYYDGSTWTKKTGWNAENLTDVDLY